MYTIYTESKSEISLPVKLFVLFGYPLRGGGQYRQPSPTRGCAITNDWRISMVRSIVVNRATSGSDQRPMYDQLLRPIARAIVASCDRAYDQSWHPTTDGTINRGIQRPIERPIVASCDRSCDCRSAIIHNWWCHHARLVVRSRNTYLRPFTIWSCRLEVLNMTIDIAATDVAIAITHDLCHQSYVLSTIYSRFQHFSVAGRS